MKARHSSEDGAAAEVTQAQQPLLLRLPKGGGETGLG